MTLLAVLDHDRGKLAEASLETLTSARALAAQMGTDLHAVLLGADGEALAGQAEAGGAAVVHVAHHEVLTDYGPEAWGAAVAELIGTIDATAVTTTGTDRGNEVMAQVAARLDLPFVANCTSIDVGANDGGPWTLTRTQWGGSLLEDATLTAAQKLVSYGHHAIEAAPADAPGAGEVRTFTPAIDASLARTVVRDRVVLTQGVTLATAPVVVSGGRGVGSEDGFAILDELAAELGGVVGCSRAVTNNGWRPHKDQVGQTGTRIAPEIYIATGISGAIQHWVGAMASKKILAINTDAEANMVSKADYAVIADLHEIVPAITEEIRRRRG